MDDRQFLELIDGLEANDLLDYSHVLTGMMLQRALRLYALKLMLYDTGYMGSVSALRGVKNAVERVRAVNPDAFYGRRDS